MTAALTVLDGFEWREIETRLYDGSILTYMAWVRNEWAITWVRPGKSLAVFHLPSGNIMLNSSPKSIEHAVAFINALVALRNDWEIDISTLPETQKQQILSLFKEHFVLTGDAIEEETTCRVESTNNLRVDRLDDF